MPINNRVVVIALVLIALTGAVNATPLQPTALRCEYIINPLGIDASSPVLSWNFSSTERNQVQTAYEIVVSTNSADVDKGLGSVWQTGKIVSRQSIDVVYGGSPLKPFTRYFWRVRIHNANNEVSAWSDVAWFETAMLKQTDWKASWIDDGRKQFDRDEDFYKDDRMPLFRKEINLSKKISDARLYVSGLGYYEAFLNGSKIGDHMLDPGWTAHRKQALYVTYDITSAMKTGQNVIGVMLGNGWYNPLPLRMFGRFNIRDHQQTGRPCLKAEVHVRYSDGSAEIIVTDNTWQTAPGPVVRNNVYLGEHYDARLEQKNWSTLAPEKSAWKNASITAGPSGELTPQLQPAVKVTRVLKAVSVKEISPGTFIADMGQNFAGVARIKVKGKSGTTIKLRYAEALNKDGSIDVMTSVAGQIKEIWNLKGGPGAPPTAWQEDRYTTKGGGLETWSPRFTFHGFRYVEITGWPGKPDVSSIEGLRMNADLEQTGAFACSNDMFNKLHDVIQWTFLSNVFSVQSDCPAREKLGYGADMVVTASAFSYDYDMHTFYRKALRDFYNDQQPDGGITETAPYIGIKDRGVGGESGPLGWQVAFPHLQWALYETYGDKRLLEQYYDATVKQVEFLNTKAIDGLFHWDISDHEALDPKPEAFSASVFYYNHVRFAQYFAQQLGREKDEEKFRKEAAAIEERIVDKYFVSDIGRFDNGTQSAQLFALMYQLGDHKDRTAKILKEEIARHKGHLSFGIFGAYHLFNWARHADQNDVAYQIANQRDYPGWAFMLSNGATTLWESWEQPDHASLNHPMFGSIDEWFYRSLLGINSYAPGFSTIAIKPQPAGDLTWARGSYRSVRGLIASDWKIVDKKITLKVTIPPNTTGRIYVPAATADGVRENGMPVVDQAGMKMIEYRNGYVVIETGSGDYTFESVLK